LLLVALSCGAWQSARLARDHRKLATKIAALRAGDDSQVAPSPPVDPTTTKLEIARLREELAVESARLEQTQERLKEAEKGLPAMTGEELRSLGRMEEFAQRAAAFIEQVAELGTMLKDNTSSSRKDEALARAMQQMGKWAGWLEVVGQMEDTPDEIAQLHAQTIAERLGLDQPTTARIRDQIAREFTDLAASGLVRSQRPTAAESSKEWNERRSEALHGAASRIEDLIPESHRRPWIVEQSLQLGNAMRQEVHVEPDGHGSAIVAVALPGVQM
jgi:hypothetical protein